VPDEVKAPERLQLFAADLPATGELRAELSHDGAPTWSGR
jgi:hypothetical protein